MNTNQEKQNYSAVTLREIQEITDHCLKLLSCTEYLRRDEATVEAHEFAEGIFKSIRKLFIASMMHDKKLICISGLQGAGKTTLMKNFYHLDDTYLNPTRGRGERIPVLITERDGITQPIMHAVRIEKDMNNGSYTRKEEELDSEKFIQASKGEDSSIMFLELFVPFRYAYNESVSFMLLPGFEKKNDYWNNLIEFSVNSSDAAVFVFNETSLSNADNEQYLRRIEEKFGKNLVYVITGSDGSSDDNAGTRDTCINLLKIPQNETNRVVCVGAYSDSEKNESWCRQFQDALEMYAYRETQQYQSNNDYICREIGEIKTGLYQILTILRDADPNMPERRNDALLKAFDRAVRKKRDELQENLNREFAAAQGKSIEKLEKLFSERPKLETIKRMFFGSSVRDQYTQTREMVQKSLLTDNDELYLADRALCSALECSLKGWDHPKKKTDFARMLDIDEDEKGENILIPDGEKSQALSKDIKNLLSDFSQRKDQFALQSTNTKKVLSAVAEISTYYFILTSHNEIAAKTGACYYEPAQLERIPDKLINGGESSKHFAAGLAGIMGIDLIGDGTINMVSQIAASMGVAVPVAGAAALAIVGIGSTSALMKDLNRIQRDDFQSARLAVQNIYDDLKQDVMKKFDTYTETVRERMEDNLNELDGNNRSILVQHNAMVEVHNALNILDEITNRCAGEQYGLESAFS